MPPAAYLLLALIIGWIVVLVLMFNDRRQLPQDRDDADWDGRDEP